VRRIANNQDRSYNVGVLSKRLLRISKNITQESRNQFNSILGTDIADFATELANRLNRDWAGMIKILQGETFLNLCENYERTPRIFIEAVTAVDDVSSQVLFKAADGTELKPVDYIQMFERFVKDNPEHIQALEILLSKPKEFHTKELKDLRLKLETSPIDMKDKFTELNLRKAYDKQLADIISIIKHAAKGDEFLTAESRIDKAFEKICQSRHFTKEQEKWLDLIRHHMIKNLLVEKDDFDSLPIFTREGITFNSLNRIFDGKLNVILSELNEAVLL